jgi:hypothetical protein
MDALGTVAAVFRATAGLDAHEGTDLDLGRVEEAPVDRMGTEQEIVERQPEQAAYFVPRPVSPDGGHGR